MPSDSDFHSSPAAPALVDSESCEVPCARRAMNFSACESTLGATRAAFIDSGAGGDSSVGGHPSMMEEFVNFVERIGSGGGAGALLVAPSLAVIQQRGRRAGAGGRWLRFNLRRVILRQE